MKTTRILNGYRVLYVGEHPASMTSSNWEGYVYEHILVAERHLGRSLHSDEEVHHLNGNRADNAIENLLVLLKSQHTKLHNWLRDGAPGGELLGMNRVNSGEPKAARYCSVCDGALTHQQMLTCSRKCDAVSRQKEPPSREALEQELESMSIYAIRNKYRVSDRTVYKWMATYGLSRQS